MRSIKVFLIVIVLAQLFSCSESNSTVLPIANLEGPNPTMCPESYHMVWTNTAQFVLFKDFSANCRRGFGFCFIKVTMGFDCVKNKVQVIDPPNPGNHPKWNSGDDSIVINIEQISATKARIWFDENMVYSPSHNGLTDFDYLTIGDVDINGGQILLDHGTYPKVIRGNYFTYDVDATFH